MKYKTLVIILLTITPVVMSAQEKNKQAVVNCPPLRTYTTDQLVFQAGERLTIVANYKWGIINADVGEATMVVSEESFRDTQYFSVRAFATTYKFWDNFFMVRDVYEGHFDTRTLRPIYFHRSIHEGDYKILATMHFNDEDYTIKTFIKRNNNPVQDSVLKAYSCTYDFISLFFNSRNLDFSNLEVGKIFPFSFAIDDEMFNLGYRFVGREEKKIPGLGTFKTLRFAAKLIAGDVFTGENELDIWISDDENRVPLLLQSPIIVGRVSARLSKYANLKYPLTSKIK